MGNIFSGRGNKIFSWKINGFSSLLQSPETDLQSRTFQQGGYNWRMMLSIRVVGTHQILGLFIVLDRASSMPPDVVIHTEFEFGSLDQLHDKVLTYGGVTAYFTNTQDKWGVADIIYVEEFQQPTRGLLVNDNCNFDVDFLRVDARKVSPSGMPACVSVPMPTFHTHTWRIEKFSELQRPGAISENFGAGGHMWKLELYHEERRCNTILGIYLTLASTSLSPFKSELFVAYSFWLLDQINGNHKNFIGGATYDEKSSTLSTGWGISLGEFCDPSNGFLVNDACSIQVAFATMPAAFK